MYLDVDQPKQLLRQSMGNPGTHLVVSTLFGAAMGRCHAFGKEILTQEEFLVQNRRVLPPGSVSVTT